jgi:hypothetical protein
MNKAAVNHHKAHKPRQWPTGARSPRVGVPSSGVRHGPAARVAGAPGVERPRGCNFPHVRESLNWTLRRYVRALSLRVSLRRQAPGTGGTPVPAGRDRLRRAAAQRAGAARKAGSPVPAERMIGVSLSTDHALRYRIHRNRQMEHLTQVAASLRGGVRRGAAITTREHPASRDLLSTTLSYKTCV